ncbi:MAG: isoprenylcysteine carboxylmethyltransferase family protein [Chloroflexi bacterium]|jgi:protein-S-isoprenylcysteine O-methyltransferase Ste14|nr:isoprenylcysteine carboxylmethyltransferase family protein [Chloroflexota bacterium]
MDPAENHFGQWGNVALWIVLGLLFLVFIPFNRKSQRKPSSVYAAFIVAMAFEMFGVPMSMYIIAWIVGDKLPDGILWGHTLYSYIGHTGMYVGMVLMLVGAALVITGWHVVYKRYWRQEEGKGELVTDGIYRFIRHPQYTGFLLITLGMLLDWATLPMLIMWPIMAVMYYRLARKEEGEMVEAFGHQYVAYRQRTGMFLPRLFGARPESGVSPAR